jgi:hypothetical protein
MFLPADAPSKAKALHGNRGSEWRLLPPVTYQNLTLFPITTLNVNPSTADAYITLDEGIKNGTVIITERGAEGSIAQRTPGQGGANQVQVSATRGGSATVNQLSLINKSGKKLLLLAGEVVVGGKQDRIVEEDLIVPPVSVPISINVFCVEHGRWSPRGQAASNRANVVRQSRIQNPRIRNNENARSNPRVQSVPQPVSHNDHSFSSLGAISHPKLRAAAQDKKQQGEVWKEVSANNARLGTATSTDTYQEVYASKKVAGTMENYIRALEKSVLAPNVVGVVVARNGELVWADAFASPALFAKYWPKLLKSYVIDAMSEQHIRRNRRPTIFEAQQYLQELQGTSSAAGKPGIYRLTKTEHAQYAIFRLEDISLPAALRLHFNKMNR